MQQETIMDHGRPPEPGPACDPPKGAGAPRRAWEVEIDVHLKSDGPNPNFKIVSQMPVDPSDNIIFENKHRPGFNIRFNLIDETGSSPPYTFPPQPKVKEACWSKVGSNCPTTASWEVFDPQRVENSNTTLLVFNANPSPALGDFKYTLRVTKDGGTTYCELDPGGVDKNGATS